MPPGSGRRVGDPLGHAPRRSLQRRCGASRRRARDRPPVESAPAERSGLVCDVRAAGGLDPDAPDSAPRGDEGRGGGAAGTVRGRGDPARRAAVSVGHHSQHGDRGRLEGADLDPRPRGRDGAVRRVLQDGSRRSQPAYLAAPAASTRTPRSRSGWPWRGSGRASDAGDSGRCCFLSGKAPEWKPGIRDPRAREADTSGVSRQGAPRRESGSVGGSSRP